VTNRNRYRQEALGGLSPAREYNPRPIQLAPPVQGHLALDGGVLGPLFNKPIEEDQMTTTTTPTAYVWWSPRHCAWGCQIGDDRSWHYNECDAISYGERLGAAIALRSLIQGEWV
jgi:hypothetical protein